jgi:hypothetical protein
VKHQQPLLPSPQIGALCECVCESVCVCICCEHGTNSNVRYVNGFAKKHWLLTWAHKLTKSRRKPWHSCLHFVSVFADTLQSPWVPERTGLIDNMFTRRDGENCPKREHRCLLRTAITTILEPSENKDWHNDQQATLWPGLFSRAYLPLPAPVLPLCKAKAHVCTPKMAEDGLSAYSAPSWRVLGHVINLLSLPSPLPSLYLVHGASGQTWHVEAQELGPGV